jgi:hypothetical protein
MNFVALHLSARQRLYTPIVYKTSTNTIPPRRARTQTTLSRSRSRTRTRRRRAIDLGFKINDAIIEAKAKAVEHLDRRDHEAPVGLGGRPRANSQRRVRTAYEGGSRSPSRPPSSSSTSFRSGIRSTTALNVFKGKVPYGSSLAIQLHD